MYAIWFEKLRTEYLTRLETVEEICHTVWQVKELG